MGVLKIMLIFVVCINLKPIECNKVLLLSFDGFRWDYINQFYTPNLDMLTAEGVHAPLGVHSAFVTQTFPNHYTLATGLYEESHGIVNNKMFDPKFNATFNTRNHESRWWDGGQPIWTTVTLKGLKAGAYAWPGSEVVLNDVMPLKVGQYDKEVSFEQRIDNIVSWFLKDNLDFACAYFHEPDEAGHTYGVMTQNVEKAVEKVDTLIGYLINKLKKASIWNSTNIIVVSDHGMTNLTADNKHVIEISKYLDFDEEIEIMPDFGALVNILPKIGKKEIVYRNLKDAHRNMTVYLKENIPERFHYSKHRRILPIVAVADEGYCIIKERSKDPKARILGPGEHGYDNDLPSMRPIFFARGPDFKSGFKVPVAFETVNVYSLICHLLHISPAPNNGTLAAYADMLVHGST